MDIAATHNTQATSAEQGTTSFANIQRARFTASQIESFTPAHTADAISSRRPNGDLWEAEI